MTNALWARIEPSLSRAEHVHLQGWGEPLLHPMLRMMARAAKGAGAAVGITTNGDLLDSAADWIIDERVDLLAVSVAGNEETHSRFRGGSRLERLMASVGDLTSRIRARKGCTRVQISYLLTRENAPHLSFVVNKAAGVKVHEFFVVHLDVTPSKELLDLAAFGREGMPSEIMNHLDEAERTARQHRIRFRGPPRFSEDVLACALDPSRFVFVGWDGRVGPCVNLLLPVSGIIPRWDHGGHRAVDPVSYGQLRDADLEEILNGGKRAAFVSPFKRRLEAEGRFRSACLNLTGMDAMKQLEEADQRRDKALRSSPFPMECAGCHKRMGW